MQGFGGGGWGGGACASYPPHQPTPQPPSRIGWHQAVKKGEDCVHADQVSIGADNVSVCLIADGHDGNEAAKVVAANLISSIVARARGDPSPNALRMATEAVFAAVHEQVRTLVPKTSSGAAVVLCLHNETRAEVLCFSLGDEAAIFVPNLGHAQLLTESHLLECNHEEVQPFPPPPHQTLPTPTPSPALSSPDTPRARAHASQCVLV